MNIEALLNEIKAVTNFTNNNPTVSVNDTSIIVSAEDGNYFADYWGEFRDNYPYIHEELVAIANRYNLYWEWENPAAISLTFV